MFYRPFHTLLAIVSAALLLAPPASAQESVFTVNGVTASVTADSAVTAREQAFAQAQQNAFRQLAERLLSDKEMKNFKLPPDSVISSLVNDFEITDEKLSSVQYIGTYTFRFKGPEVRNYLNGEGLTFTDVGSKPVLVLPFWQTPQGTVLWGNANPWLAAWSSGETWQGLVPATVPMGDVQDRADVGDPSSTRPEALARMMGRYGAGEAVVMVATPFWPAGVTPANVPEKIDVAIYSTDTLPPKPVTTLSIRAETGDTLQSLLARAVRETRGFLQDKWKNRTLTSREEKNNLTVRVRFSSMQEWIDTQKSLRGVQGVNEVNLLSLKPGEAYVRLVFQGSEERLRTALAQSDMTLTTPQVVFGAASGSPLVYDLYLSRYRSAVPGTATPARPY